jgi:hypothetical protein
MSLKKCDTSLHGRPSDGHKTVPSYRDLDLVDKSYAGRQSYAHETSRSDVQSRTLQRLINGCPFFVRDVQMFTGYEVLDGVSKNLTQLI